MSHCERDEVRAYMDCLRRISDMTFHQVIATGSKGSQKTGLNYTPYDEHAIKGASWPQFLSRDMKIGGVRAGSKLRLFGVFIERVFHVMWFDRNHVIVPV